jgi:hypothetical protein
VDGLQSSQGVEGGRRKDARLMVDHCRQGAHNATKTVIEWVRDADDRTLEKQNNKFQLVTLITKIKWLWMLGNALQQAKTRALCNGCLTHPMPSLSGRRLIVSA